MAPKCQIANNSKEKSKAPRRKAARHPKVKYFHTSDFECDPKMKINSTGAQL